MVSGSMALWLATPQGARSLGQMETSLSEFSDSPTTTFSSVKRLG